MPAICRTRSTRSWTHPRPGQASRAKGRRIDPLTLIGGAAIAAAIALVTTPAGVSGAVFLVPVQVGLLGVANPAVTPTNLIYNLIAIPGSLAGYRGAPSNRPELGSLARTLVAGSVPGVVLGAILRVELLSDARTFDGIIALMLAGLGAWLLLLHRDTRGRTAGPPRGSTTIALSFAVGVIGGIYGIGGGSLLAPILVGLGVTVRLVAPAALTATFVASLAGVVTFVVFSAAGSEGSVAPEWALGVALGLGGMAGGFAGAKLQPRLPERTIRRGLGLVALIVAARFGAQAL